MNIRTALSFIAMLVISAGALAYMIAVGLPINFHHERNASMVVDDTNGLVVGSRVLLRGTEIGAVTAITPDAEGVHVDWKYNGELQIPVDSNFRVDNLSALGETYIAVLPDGTFAPYLVDYAQIDSSRVHVPSTINDLSKQFTRLLNQLDTERIQSLLGELEVGLPSGSETIDTIERASALTAAMLDDTSGSLSSVLTNAQTMLSDSSFIPPGLAGTAEHIGPFGVGFNKTMSAAVYLTVLSPLPDSLVFGTGPLLANLQAFLDRSGADIEILAVDALPGAQAGAQALRTVNIGALLDQALAAAADGAITLQVGGGN